MPLFEVDIVKKPTKKDAEDGAVEELVLAPTPVIARDSQGAGIAAVVKADLKIDLQRCEVLVRPFA